MKNSSTCRFALMTVFCFLGISIMAVGGFAEDLKRAYSFKAGYWVPGERIVREVLGNGVSFGGTLSLPLSSGRWIDFTMNYWRKSGDFPPLRDETLPGSFTYRRSKVTLAPLSLSLRAEGMPLRGIRPFVLGGIDLNAVKEEVRFTQTYPEEPVDKGTNSISNAFLGFHFGGGAETDLSPRTSLFFQLMLSVANADTEGVGGLIANGVSLGGIGAFAGIRYR